MQVFNKTTLALLYMPELVPVSVRLQLIKWVACNHELKKALVATRKNKM